VAPINLPLADIVRQTVLLLDSPYATHPYTLVVSIFLLILPPSALLAKYYLGERMKKNQMGEVYGTYGEEKRCI